MSFSQNHARREQSVADGRRHDDAAAQSRTIVGDADGHWLITTLTSMWHDDQPVHTDRIMRFGFLAEGTEAVLSQLSRFDSAAVIEMPAGSRVRKIEGTDFDSWLFRVDDGADADPEWFDVAYREIETGDHLLYLKAHSPSGKPPR